MSRLIAIILKEFNQIKRDKRTVALLLFFPAFLLMIFGYAVDFDVKHLKIGILDLDNSQESREMTQELIMYEHFDLQYSLKKYDEIDRYLDSGEIKACVVIPEDYSRNLRQNGKASIQVIIDGTNSNTGMTALGNINSYIMNHSSRIVIESFMKAGLKTAPVPVELVPRVWYNLELKSIKFLVPGLIGFIMMITCVIATSLSIVKEKERFTIEQLSVSPVRPYELIIGKTFPYMVISLATMVMIIVLGMILFDITIKGSILSLFLTSMIFIIGALGLGMFISTLTDSQQAAYMISVLSTMLPAMILSGFVFPINSMPKVIQGISCLVQLRYFLVILRSIMLKGTGLAGYTDQLIYMSLISLVLIIISSVKITKSL